MDPISLQSLLIKNSTNVEQITERPACPVTFNPSDNTLSYALDGVKFIVPNIGGSIATLESQDYRDVTDASYQAFLMDLFQGIEEDMTAIAQFTSHLDYLPKASDYFNLNEIDDDFAAEALLLDAIKRKA